MSSTELVRLAFDEIDVSSGLAAWLAEQQLSLALTKGNSIGFIGLDAHDSVTYSDVQFGMCMGLAALGDQTLYLATRYQIWRLENGVPDGGHSEAGHDRLYIPQTAWTTGTVLVRDLMVAADGEVTFVNGLFSCLSRPSARLNFEPVWLPPFVSKLASEDRCHLSGIASRDGRPAFVTSASRSDTPRGWSEQQRDGGIVVSVATGAVIATGLSMPCSPVLHEGRLWVCLGGSGELGVLELGSGEVTKVATLPGFTRGLAIHDGYAVVCVSGPSRGESFDGLPLSDRLHDGDARGRCGVYVVNLTSGAVEHWLRFAGGVSEIHALALLPGVRSASVVSFAGDDAQELVTLPAEVSER